MPRSSQIPDTPAPVPISATNPTPSTAFTGLLSAGNAQLHGVGLPDDAAAAAADARLKGIRGG